MKVLITGAGAMLAQALVPELRRRGHDILALSRKQLDVTEPVAVRDAILAWRPDAVVQCAAYTAVDAAEGDEVAAFRVNAEGARNVVRACGEVGTLFVYPSSDYVFPGTASRPYRPDDATDPLNAYGRSKRAGEEAAAEAGRSLVVRTSWLYGEGGSHFVDTIRRLARERGRVEVVNDQMGRPTWSATLARAMAELTEKGARGVFHVTDAGEPVTWHEFAQAILADEPVEVVPVPSTRFPRPAARPVYSVLDCSATEALLGYTLPDWRDSLARYSGAVRGSNVMNGV